MSIFIYNNYSKNLFNPINQINEKVEEKIVSGL